MNTESTDTVVHLYYVVSEYTNNNSAVRNTLMLSTTLESFSYPASQQPPPEDHLQFEMLFKIFEFLITNFISPSNPIFNAHEILQYRHLNLRPDLVHNICGNVTMNMC